MQNEQPIVNLRPLGVGELIDGVFRLYRANFFTLIGIAAVTQIPLGLLQIFLQDTSLGGRSTLDASTVLTCITSLASSLLLILTQAALMVAAARFYLGKPATLPDAYGTGWSRFGSLLLAGFLEGLAIGIPAGVIGVVSAITGCSVIGIILIIPYAAYLGTRWCVYAPGILIENIGGSEGLSRSWNLTNQYFWRAFGVLLVNGLLVYIISGLPQLIVQYGGTQVISSFRLVQALSQTISALGTTLTLPISAAATVLLYYDLRVRKEGYDLQVLAEQTAAQARLEAEPQRPEPAVIFPASMDDSSSTSSEQS